VSRWMERQENRLTELHQWNELLKLAKQKLVSTS